MPDIDFYVLHRQEGDVRLGETDPWGAERFELSPFSVDLRTRCRSNHSRASPALPADQAAATDTIRRWAGLPAATPEQLKALRDPISGEPDLDQIDRRIRHPL
jgi:hypothetical protein